MDIEDLTDKAKAREMTVSERNEHLAQSSHAYDQSTMKQYSISGLRGQHTESLHVWLAYSLWQTVTRLLPTDETDVKLVNQRKADCHFRIRRTYFAFKMWADPEWAVSGSGKRRSAEERFQDRCQDRRALARKLGDVYKLHPDASSRLGDFKPEPVLMPKRHSKGTSNAQEPYCAIPGLCECTRM